MLIKLSKMLRLFKKFATEIVKRASNFVKYREFANRYIRRCKCGR